jgi:C4-dicarboxylate transporter DctM subunit
MIALCTGFAKDVSIVDVYRKVLPFVAVDLVRLALLTAFPAITLLLSGS